MVGACFILLHLYHTGGTWQRFTLLRHAPSAWGLIDPRGHTHLTYRRKPKEVPDLPAIIFVRNPWDWCVGRWAKAWAYEGNLKDPKPWRKRKFPESLEAMGSQWSLYQDFIAGAPRVVVGRFEQLPHALPEAIRELGIGVAQETEKAICSERPVNWTRHKPYREYYSQGLRDLVAKREAPLIEKFGYSF